MDTKTNLYRKHVFICVSGKTCPGEGSEAVLEQMRKCIKERGLRKEIRINKSGCLDQCGNGPMVVVYPDGVWYAKVKPADCEEIVESHLLGEKPINTWLYP